MWEFLEEATEHFVIEIYSTRSETAEGRAAMKAWFEDHADTTERSDIAHRILRFPECKPKAFVGLDDRIITFCGQWPAVESLRSFKPWNKGGPVGVVVQPYQRVSFAMTKQQIEDLRALLFIEKRAGMVTGGSSVAAESKRRRDTFEHLYNQLPPGLPPDVPS
jgi:hypothetical protein